MNPYVARALGAVAAVLAITAIWIKVRPRWDDLLGRIRPRTGIAMHVLAILTGAGIVLASLTQKRALDQIWLLPGLVLGLGLDSCFRSRPSEPGTSAIFRPVAGSE